MNTGWTDLGAVENNTHEVYPGSHTERTFELNGKEICVWDVGFAVKARINGTKKWCYARNEADALRCMILEMQNPEPQAIVNDPA